MCGNYEISSPSVNSYVRGIPSSQEGKMHECIKVSLFLKERGQRDILLAVLLVFAGFRKGFSAENLSFRRQGMTD